MDGLSVQNPVIFNVFEGEDFEAWAEEIMLMLNGHGLMGGGVRVRTIAELTKMRTRKTIEAESCEWKRQQAYAVISLNLSKSCRDCLRHLGDK
jgi:hypothetical protein